MIHALLTRPIPKPYRNKPLSDPQRSRLYMMEREYVGVSIYHHVSKDNLETIMRHACMYYRIKAPKLIIYNAPNDQTFGYSESIIHADGTRSRPEILLNRGFHGANACTLLHELAHYIADNTWTNYHGHGPKFVAIYMHLLDKYRILPSVCFRALAAKLNVRIHNRFKPDAIRG